jgi:hypothetical protein
LSQKRRRDGFIAAALFDGQKNMRVLSKIKVIGG